MPGGTRAGNGGSEEQLTAQGRMGHRRELHCVAEAVPSLAVGFEDMSKRDWWGTAHPNLPITVLQAHFLSWDPVAYA